MTSSEKSALHWSAAKEAEERIAHIRSTLLEPQEKNPASSASDEALKRSLDELEGIRGYLRKGIAVSNQEFLSGRQRDQVLHAALERGLSDLDGLRTSIVSAINAQPAQPAPPKRSSGASGSFTKSKLYNDIYGKSSDAPAQPQPQPQSQPPQSKGAHTPAPPKGGPAEDAKATASSWGQYHDWAQNVLNRVHSRKLEQQKTAFFRQLSGKAPAQREGNYFSREEYEDEIRDDDGDEDANDDDGSVVSNSVNSSNASAKGKTKSKSRQSYNFGREEGGESPDNDSGRESAPKGANRRPTSSSGQQGTDASRAQKKPSFSAGIPRAASASVNGRRQPVPEDKAPPARAESGTAARPLPSAAGGRPPMPSGSEESNARTNSFRRGVFNRLSRPESANFSQPTASKPSTPSQAAEKPIPAGGGEVPPRVTRPSTAGLRPSSAPPSANGTLHPEAQQLREQGNIAFQQKKFKDSADAYSRAIDQYAPNSETLLCNRAAAFLMMNRCYEALADSIRAIEIDPQHVKAHWRAAKACLHLGRSDEARHLYQKAHKLSQNIVGSTETEAIHAEMRAVELAERARRCLRLRDYAEALRVAEILLEIFPINGPCAGPWVCLKCEALLYSDPQAAQNLLAPLCTDTGASGGGAGPTANRMASTNTSEVASAEAWLLRGKALFYAAHDASSTTAAIQHINKARDFDVGKPSVLVTEGNHGFQSYFSNKTSASISAAIGAFFSREMPSLASCGPSSFLNTVTGRAASLINTIESFAKLRDAGNAAYAGGRWSEAHDLYSRSLTVDPQNNSLRAIILCNRAAVYIQQEKWREALDDINLSINLNNGNAKAFSRRARIQQQLGNFDASVRDLQTAVSLYPSAENHERLLLAQEMLRKQSTNTTSNTASGGTRFGMGSRPFTAGAARGASSGPSGTTEPKTSASSSYTSFFSGHAKSTQQSRPGSAFFGASGAYFRQSTFGASSGARPSSAQGGTSRATAAPSQKQCYYAVLNITRTAGEKDVTKAYREAALKWHPDKWAGGSDSEKVSAEEKFKELSVAYNVLRDTHGKRRQYDLGGNVS